MAFAMTDLVLVRSKLPPGLRRKVGNAITAWFEHLGEPSRILYRRGLVHFAEWLVAQEAIGLDAAPEAGSDPRAAWEDGACAKAGQYLLGFPFHEAIHLTEAYLADCLYADPKLSRATASSRLASLRWAAREARRQNLIVWDLQTAKMPRPRKDRHGKLVERRGRNMRGPTPEQKEALLQAALTDVDPRVAMVISMCLNEGYREHEIRQIDLADLSDKTVELVRKKRGEPVAYPLCAMTSDRVARWLKIRGKQGDPLLCGGRRGSLRMDRRIGGKALFRWVLRCCEAAEVEPFSPHRLRHRACTDIVNWAVKMAIPEERILFLTGHSNRSALQPYYDDLKDVDSMREVLDASSGRPPKKERSKRPSVSTQENKDG